MSDQLNRWVKSPARMLAIDPKTGEYDMSALRQAAVTFNTSCERLHIPRDLSVDELVEFAVLHDLHPNGTTDRLDEPPYGLIVLFVGAIFTLSWIVAEIAFGLL